MGHAVKCSFLYEVVTRRKRLAVYCHTGQEVRGLRVEQEPSFFCVLGVIWLFEFGLATHCGKRQPQKTAASFQYLSADGT